MAESYVKKVQEKIGANVVGIYIVIYTMVYIAIFGVYLMFTETPIAGYAVIGGALGFILIFAIPCIVLFYKSKGAKKRIENLAIGNAEYYRKKWDEIKEVYDKVLSMLPFENFKDNAYKFDRIYIGKHVYRIENNYLFTPISLEDFSIYEKYSFEDLLNDHEKMDKFKSIVINMCDRHSSIRKVIYDDKYCVTGLYYKETDNYKRDSKVSKTGLAIDSALYGDVYAAVKAYDKLEKAEENRYEIQIVTTHGTYTTGLKNQAKVEQFFNKVVRK